ncbi:hypothetical protein CR513_47345, partial [Mucuna pruriens]
MFLVKEQSLSSCLTLNDVLHVPHLSYNLFVSKDLTSGNMIEGAKQDCALYFLNQGSNVKISQLSIFKVFVSKVKNYLPLRRESCELANQHHAIFQSQPYKNSKPFTMIHSDVWVLLGWQPFLESAGSLLLLMFILGHLGLSFER